MKRTNRSYAFAQIVRHSVVLFMVTLFEWGEFHVVGEDYVQKHGIFRLKEKPLIRCFPKSVAIRLLYTTT